MLVKPSQIWSNLVKLGQMCYKLVLFGAGHYSTYGYFSKGLSSVTPTRDPDTYQSDRSSSRCPSGDLNNYKPETSINISPQYMSFGRFE